MESLIKILQLAHESGHKEIAKEALMAMGREYGIIAPLRYKTIQDIPFTRLPLQVIVFVRLRNFVKGRWRTVLPTV